MRHSSERGVGDEEEDETGRPGEGEAPAAQALGSPPPSRWHYPHITWM